MEKLWAPWRLEYIKNADKMKEEGCIFCDLPEEGPENDRKNLIIFRGKRAFVILNKYPYNNGHLMVVPYRHTRSLEELDTEEKLELMDLLEKSVGVLEKAYAPHGFNIGMNLGRVAGAGIDEHIHFHIVPRWNGDTNFMPVVANTKVISASLDDTFDQLRPYFENLLK